MQIWHVFSVVCWKAYRSLEIFRHKQIYQISPFWSAYFYHPPQDPSGAMRDEKVLTKNRKRVILSFFLLCAYRTTNKKVKRIKRVSQCLRLTIFPHGMKIHFGLTPFRDHYALCVGGSKRFSHRNAVKFLWLQLSLWHFIFIPQAKVRVLTRKLSAIPFLTSRYYINSILSGFVLQTNVRTSLRESRTDLHWNTIGPNPVFKVQSRTTHPRTLHFIMYISP